MSNKENQNNESSYEEEENSEESSSSYYSSSESYQRVNIKKEKIKTISIDIKIYNKLINLLQKTLKINKDLQQKLINQIDKEVQTEQIYNEFNNNNDNINNNNIKEKDDKKNNVEINKNNENFSSKNILKNNLEKEENIFNFDLNEYEIEIKKLNEKILILTEENKKLKEENENLKIEHKNEINKIETSTKEDLMKISKKIDFFMENDITSSTDKFSYIYNNLKIFYLISDYLEYDDLINLSKVNIKLYQTYFFRTNFKFIIKKYSNLKKLKDNLKNDEEVEKLYNINNEELKNIYKDYLKKAKVCGFELKKAIINSLLLLEKDIINHMKNVKDLKPEIKDIYNIPKFEENINKIPNNNYTTIKFFEEEKIDIKELNEKDNYILNIIKNDKILNLLFPYDNPKIIDKIITNFVNHKFKDQDYFHIFLEKLCRKIFPDLLISSAKALKDIQNLEIIKYSLYYRYLKIKLDLTDIEEENSTLKDNNESIRNTMEIFKQYKYDIENKYNNNLLNLNNIQKKYEKNKENYENLKKEYENFKIGVQKEYSVLKTNFSIIQKENEFLKNILKDFKNYFMKYIDDKGEILE